MPAPLPTRRVVLLGASNVARSISTIVETSQLCFGEPLDVMAAIGHGRSFGVETSVFGRKISGIFSCGLWDDLKRRAPLPTVALLTDVGNDIGYGERVDSILYWVESCLDQLLEVDANIVVTLLPIDRLRACGELSFRIARSLFFPFSDLSRTDALARTEEVNQRLTAGCEKRGIRVFPVKQSWFGLDPIHVRRSIWPVAWPEILSPWGPPSAPLPAPRGSLRRWFYLRTRAPQSRSIFWFQQAREQPSGRLNDGTLISFY